ncbi:MAG: ABC-F family ATP-binding cassette domain-containing protein [Verrucomicrobia bacterium]|nr:ABC-F family ATP-binding cassette domain-containing protein [Verrucomicrobiota bacterium]MBS0645733.1 ABC-F family ATP-binding cassette domain-containing protein [Verrucomicrobiota bacterium]
MLLLNAELISKSFGTKKLFSELSLSIFSDDRIGLIGQNGSGKSTFLKILAGLEQADNGTLSLKKGLKIGYLPQSCDFVDQPPLTILLEALKEDTHTPLYEKERLAQTWLSKLGFKGDEPSASRLSGGWKKRLMLAQQMLFNPDLLLLDEPTNHLDLEGILWLEKFLKHEAPTYLLVSHDRYFLQHATNRMIEIAPCYPRGLFSIQGPYLEFLHKKEEFLEGQLQQEHSLASKVRRESQWLRSNPKARTTKAQARVDQAHKLLDELPELKKRNQQTKVAIDFSGSGRETRKLLVAKNIGKELNGKVLFQDLDFTLSPGTRIGLMGPNGSGKTTLLRLLAHELSADTGTIKRAEGLQTVYFDQHRHQLPSHLSLREALAPQDGFINFRGKSIHIHSWCKRFLFSPDLLDLPLSVLSGGERARIAIAHLMLQPADLLLLDEPTNDLDIPTLEALEASLLEFPGAVVLITHDRCMLDRICTSLLPLGDPSCHEIFADYAQWEESQKPTQQACVQPSSVKQKPTPAKKGLSYKEKKELEDIESFILKAEQEVQELTLQLEQTQDNISLSNICQTLAIAEAKVEQLYLRWEELESKQHHKT